MKTPLRRFGNSQGIVIPRRVLSRLHIEDAIDLEVVDGHIELHPIAAPRAGWAEAFSGVADPLRELSEDEEVFLTLDLDE